MNLQCPQIILNVRNTIIPTFCMLLCQNLPEGFHFAKQILFPWRPKLNQAVSYQTLLLKRFEKLLCNKNMSIFKTIV